LPQLAAEEVKLKNKTICARYAAEVAGVIKSEKKIGAILHDIYIPKLF
jgi:hypothetical protein